MAKLTKRAKKIAESIDRTKIYTFDEALSLLKKLSTVKFKESIDIAVNLGVDPKKSDQVVRGSVVLPKGTGRDMRVAVFTQGANVKIAKDAGADLVGMEDLAEQVKAGNMDFDVVIASPDAMRIVGQLGQILGPRGMMPNPKLGTVTPNIGAAVENAKSGQIRFRTDKNGIIHSSIGNIDFEISSLLVNAQTLLNELKRLKPASSKGAYMKKISFSTTMGPGLTVDIASLGVK